jgi:hypothetical protein
LTLDEFAADLNGVRADESSSVYRKGSFSFYHVRWAGDD